MNRHFARIVAMQSLYEADFRGNKEPQKVLERNCNNLQTKVDKEFASKLIKLVVEHSDDINKIISDAAPEWPYEQIALVDRNILRLAVAELMYDKEVPPKVVMNEAIEIAKNYGGENTSKFVNGVLGTIYRSSDRYVPEEDKGGQDE